MRLLTTLQISLAIAFAVGSAAQSSDEALAALKEAMPACAVSTALAYNESYPKKITVGVYGGVYRKVALFAR
jgi:hypothetical protein